MRGFSKIYGNRILFEANFFILIIHKPSLGSCEVPEKFWARSVPPFWGLLYTNKKKQRSKVYRWMISIKINENDINKNTSNQKKIFTKYLAQVSNYFFSWKCSLSKNNKHDFKEEKRKNDIKNHEIYLIKVIFLQVSDPVFPALCAAPKYIWLK